MEQPDLEKSLKKVQEKLKECSDSNGSPEQFCEFFREELLKFKLSGDIRRQFRNAVKAEASEKIQKFLAYMLKDENPVSWFLHFMISVKQESFELILIEKFNATYPSGTKPTYENVDAIRESIAMDFHKAAVEAIRRDA